MKNKIISISFCTYLALFLLINIFTPDNEISVSERRKLNQLPSSNITNIFSKKTMIDFDNYVVDQFIFRDSFRSIKANYNYKILNMTDNNGYYVYNNSIIKTDYKTNINSINNFKNKINNISSNFTSNNNIYYSIIPDKGYFVNSNKYLNIDYNLIYERVSFSNFKYIELRDILSLNDYYETDTHWKEANLLPVVERIGSVMNFNSNSSYKKNVIKDFYGVYYGSSAINRSSEDIIYLTNDIIDNASVYYLEDNSTSKVYTFNKQNSLDKYDMFLDGSSSFITITNNKNNSGRELIVFRDSFASSLIPLLIESYSKITVIDTRYIASTYYLPLINFNDQDILFLYSTNLINNSYSLKD